MRKVQRPAGSPHWRNSTSWVQFERPESDSSGPRYPRFDLGDRPTSVASGRRVSAGVGSGREHSERARKRARDGPHSAQNEPTPANGARENPSANRRSAEGCWRARRTTNPKVGGSIPSGRTTKSHVCGASEVALPQIVRVSSTDAEGRRRATSVRSPVSRRSRTSWPPTTARRPSSSRDAEDDGGRGARHFWTLRAILDRSRRRRGGKTA